MGYLNKLFALIVNKQYSIRTQLRSSFSIITVISGGLTLAICFGLLFSLARQSSETSRKIIELDTKAAVLTNAKEISNSINQHLSVIGQSLTLESTIYSQLLFENSHPAFENITILSKKPYFREYNFQGSTCPFPLCPADYGPLVSRSRFPNLPDFQYGSVGHSSVYMYSSFNHSAIRDDSTWDWICNRPSDSNLTLRGIESLSYLDDDFKLMYTRGPNTTVMFYSSMKIDSSDLDPSTPTPTSSPTSPSGSSTPASNSYISLHRTFPGIVKSQTSSISTSGTSTGSPSVAYDPSSRSWFKKAPLRGNYLYGPYRETFTQQLVLTLSSKRITTLQPNIDYIPSSSSSSSLSSPKRQVTFVTAAVMLLDQIQRLISQVNYPDDGFGALITYSDYQTIFWKDLSIPTFDSTSNSFLLLNSFDQNLAKQNLRKEASFDYIDPSGVQWYVSSVPLFPIEEYGSEFSSSSSSSSPQKYAFIMLVFAKVSSAQSPLLLLNQKIHMTTTSITQFASIICCSIIGFVLFIIFGVVEYVVSPLIIAQEISKQVVQMSGLEEYRKDYSLIVHDQQIVSSLSHSYRYDEAGGDTTVDPTAPSAPPEIEEKYEEEQKERNGNKLKMKNKNDPTSKKNKTNKIDPSIEDDDDDEEREGEKDEDIDLDVLGGIMMTIAPPSSSSSVSSPSSSSSSYDPIPLKDDSMETDEHHPHIPSSLSSGYQSLPTTQSSSDFRHPSLSSSSPPPTATATTTELFQLPTTTTTTTTKNFERNRLTEFEDQQQHTIDILSLKDIHLKHKKVNFCCSLKVLFFSVSTLLLGGLIATMAVTLIYMVQGGKLWMSDSEVFIVEKSMLNLNNIVSIKSTYVQVSFEL